ncbi:unnamed protein product [Rhizoctonia solani]|uniref:Uncharacterized protein n=1 Tax=Rhizoctonia solani TaxID=456999 RepID=A0A8H2WHB8_9AGAM|nr:unnamed protein product [Rhizoctonia solani]
MEVASRASRLAELLMGPKSDHSVNAFHPLQVPELMVGRGLLMWLMSESGRVVRIGKEDHNDGEQVYELEVRLSLTLTVALFPARHAISPQNGSNSHPCQ